jgi:hypothetical protein
MKALIICSLLLATASGFANGQNSASSTGPCRPGEWYWVFVDNDGDSIGERVMMVCKNGEFVKAVG